ncbi:MAG: sulfotransferase [Synechococcus sp. MED-G70]|jgi:hypothetical protein|nr:MAG: sulfotransferase [Synechococcus sp. MED-G70]
MKKIINQCIKEGINLRHQTVVDENRAVLPNFIIIGAAKSATTTLANALKRHPDIFISKPKEPKFFGRNYAKGWDWYISRFRKGEGIKFRGEASTMYASQLRSFRKAPKLMSIYLPDVKLIYIVRHPLERIVSQWRHYSSPGRHPNCADFSALMSDHRLRTLIVGCSMYYKRLNQYRKFFPDEQIYCMTFEDLLDSPRSSLRKMLKFIGARPKTRKLLDADGSLPKDNQAGAKGRGHVDVPEWTPSVRQQVTRIIQPDAERMLEYMGKPRDYWTL